MRVILVKPSNPSPLRPIPCPLLYSWSSAGQPRAFVHDTSTERHVVSFGLPEQDQPQVAARRVATWGWII